MLQILLGHLIANNLIFKPTDLNAYIGMTDNDDVKEIIFNAIDVLSSIKFNE